MSPSLIGGGCWLLVVGWLVGWLVGWWLVVVVGGWWLVVGGG
jgi:hypothetical protein